MPDPTGRRTPRDASVPPPERLEGRSLTSVEYVDAFLRWLRDVRLDGRYDLNSPWGDDAAMRGELHRAIAEEEQRSMIRRFGAGEDWRDIRESARFGRRYTQPPVSWARNS